MCLALDVAATELFKDGKYHLEGEGKVLDTDEHDRLLQGPGGEVPHHLH
jgi:enolase